MKINNSLFLVIQYYMINLKTIPYDLVKASKKQNQNKHVQQNLDVQILEIRYINEDVIYVYLIYK